MGGKGLDLRRVRAGPHLPSGLPPGGKAAIIEAMSARHVRKVAIRAAGAAGDRAPDRENTGSTMETAR
ncbi:hypothetical protein AA13595_1699 [Gluconacetobacter johannae DSM 13595]|nr:hypothetical protein AA13595_1699 [Gluconacetobacter johannae DSM 13595]